MIGVGTGRGAGTIDGGTVERQAGKEGLGRGSTATKREPPAHSKLTTSEAFD